MRVMIDSETTIVAGTSIFQVRVGTGSSDRSMKVTVTLDGRLEWTFDQPAWRPLSYGCRHGMPYLWSARALIALPVQSDRDPEVIEVDEDLLLVCETSVRLVAERGEAARVEFGDVVAHARWEQGELVVHDARGPVWRIGLDEDRLIC